jgi:single-strand DNA-binding protein
MSFNGTVTGNLARDPELKAFSNGSMVCNLVLGVKRPKRKGEDQPAFWVKAQIWGKQAEMAADWLHKGDLVLVAGEVSEERFQKRDGTQGFAVLVENARFEILNQKQAPSAAAVSPAAVQATAAAQSLASATNGVVVQGDDFEPPF